MYKQLPSKVQQLEGMSGSVQGVIGATGGSEEVYDLYDFEYAVFSYIGGGLFSSLGFGGTYYQGEVYGWKNFSNEPYKPGVANYAGKTYAVSANVNFKIGGFPGSGGGVAFWSDNYLLGGVAGVIGTGLTLCPPIDGSITNVTYTLASPVEAFHDAGKRPTSRDAEQFITFIDLKMRDGLRKEEIKRIIRENGKAWEDIRMYNPK